MSYRIEFLGIAEIELEDAVEWYGLQSKNQAPNFILAVDDLIKVIKKNPRLFPTIHKDMRKAILPDYPYSIIY